MRITAVATVIFSLAFSSVVAGGLSAQTGITTKTGVQIAQTGVPAPSYGYQPYNDRNPTGFYHPNGMGYGSYYMTPKYHGHRFHAFRYRKFKGN